MRFAPESDGLFPCLTHTNITGRISDQIFDYIWTNDFVGFVDLVCTRIIGYTDNLWTITFQSENYSNPVKKLCETQFPSVLVLHKERGTTEKVNRCRKYSLRSNQPSPIFLRLYPKFAKRLEVFLEYFRLLLHKTSPRRFLGNVFLIKDHSLNWITIRSVEMGNGFTTRPNLLHNN